MLGTGARAPKVARGPSHPLAFAGASRIWGQVEGRNSPISLAPSIGGAFLARANRLRGSWGGGHGNCGPDHVGRAFLAFGAFRHGLIRLP